MSKPRAVPARPGLSLTPGVQGLILPFTLSAYEAPNMADSAPAVWQPRAGREIRAVTS
jgi:hypothetical protein